MSSTSNTTWGWKAMLTVYVAGDQYAVERVCDAAVDAIDGMPGVDFAGAALEEVERQPKEQMGT